MPTERRRDANQHRIRLGQPLPPAGDPQPPGAECRLHRRVRDLPQGAGAGGQQGDPTRIRIERDGGEAGLDQGQGQRQPDIAKPHHRDGRLTCTEACGQGIGLRGRSGIGNLEVRCAAMGAVRG